ncbi:hypothetical protein H8790_09330 [Oscillibacter hominis]|uniref:Uncharacterized protein n=1 Tax=Oscillibacter hominis TaxID=2763056 RepID=A0A7G9B289_9FIRM|nr:hypothetical protein [Oscillibacter hominis]QNL43670.1 hypothetical protein H8790_09330 [Oscillibacter hominis]
MDLLEYLARSNHCLISDLRYRDPGTIRIDPILERSDFSLSQWNDLLQYLFDNAPRFESCGEAKAYLASRVLKT